MLWMAMTCLFAFNNFEFHLGAALDALCERRARTQERTVLQGKQADHMDPPHQTSVIFIKVWCLGIAHPLTSTVFWLRRELKECYDSMCNSYTLIPLHYRYKGGMNV